jgi:hypothetical protein
MSPIPLTLIGIIPGHWLMGAEFTATSMIGMIALGGIIVRQSILIVEFVKIEVAKGKSVREAAVAGAEIRMRPILITSLTLMAGAFAIIQDPIFQGMAVSLFFGAGVATLMAVVVIPLGCISLRKHFYLEETESGEIELSGRYAEVEEVAGEKVSTPPTGTPIWLRLWSGLVVLVIGLVGSLGRLLVSIWRLLLFIFAGLFRKRRPSPRTRPPAPGSSSPPGGASPSSGAAPVGSGGGGLQPSTLTSAVFQDGAVDSMKFEKAGASSVKRPEPVEKPAVTTSSPRPSKAGTSRSPAAGTTVSKKKASTTQKKTTQKKTSKKTSSRKKQVAKQAATKKTSVKKTVRRKTTTRKAKDGADTGAAAESMGSTPSKASAPDHNREERPRPGVTANRKGTDGAFGRGVGVRRVLEIKVKRGEQS